MTGKKYNKKKKISLAEFQAWLQGVEDLHPKDWHPTSEQWKLIRDKIMSIAEAAAAPQSSRREEYSVMPSGLPMVAGPMPSGLPMQMPRGPNGIIPAPPVLGGVPPGPVVDNSNSSLAGLGIAPRPNPDGSLPTILPTALPNGTLKSPFS